MRKWIGFVLFLLILCGAAQAQEVVQDGFVYQVENGVAIIERLAPGATSITLHETVNGCTVQWPSEWEAMRELKLEEVLEIRIVDGITSINQFVENTRYPIYTSYVNLQEVWIPASLTAIDQLLWYTPELRAFHVAPGNTWLRDIGGMLYSEDGQTLISYPSGLKGEVILPIGTRFIGDSAFNSTGQATELTLPEGIETLTQNCGLGTYMSELERLRLPASLVQIERYALPYIPGIEVAAGNPRYQMRNGILFEDGELHTRLTPIGLSVDVPAGVTKVPSNIYAYSEDLQAVSIPMGVRSIDEWAFSSSTALRRIALPLTLETIGRGTFANCVSLENLILPPGLKSIGSSAFYNCADLRSLTIPDSVTHVGSDAFPSGNFVVYAKKDSAAYWSAWTSDTLWAEPGGVPSRIERLSDRIEPAAVLSTGETGGRTPLRATTGTSGSILGEYPNGTTALILEELGNMTRVRIGELEGYVPTDRLMKTDALTSRLKLIFAQVSRKSNIPRPLRLYTLPLENSPYVEMEWDTSELLRVFDTVGCWYQVVLPDGRTGFVPTNDVHVSYQMDYESWDLYGVINNPNAQDRLNLRAQPSTGAQSLGRYFNGTQVRILSEEGDWYRVEVDGKNGYMMREYIQSLAYDESMLLDIYSGNG